jgi:predicted NACHT family NTPase
MGMHPIGLISYQLVDIRPERALQLLMERSGLLQESNDNSIEFLHNTLKEYLAAERFVNRGEVNLLADHCHDETWQPVILFALALPREGSDFATRMVQLIRDKTPLQTPAKDANFHSER